MRDLSYFEIGVVSGGDMATVEVTASHQKDDGNGFTQVALSSLPINTSAGMRIATEGLACAGAVARVKKAPTLVNAAAGSTTCSTVVTDVFKSTDWKGLLTAYGASQMADANARSFGLVKQNSN